MFPNRTNDLIELGRQFVRAMDAHRHDLAIEQFFGDIDHTLQQLVNRQGAWASAEHAKLLSAQRLELSDKALARWLGRARLVMSLVAHARPCQPLADTAAADGRRTGVPKRLQGRVALARTLVSFFARHPEFGVAFAEVTAAKGRSLYERVIQSDDMLRLARQDCLVMRQQRNFASGEVRAMLRRIIASLQTQMNGSDPRWTDFGVMPTHSRRKRSSRSTPRRARRIVFVSVSDQVHHVAAA
jgi:hypothetical protein